MQVECEHQLSLERERCGEAMRLKSAAEERYALTEARCAATEAAFEQFKAAQRTSPEAALQSQVNELQQALKTAQAAADKARSMKKQYKEQVGQWAVQGTSGVCVGVRGWA